MIALSLAACLSDPGNGTFVGNPGVNLDASSPPTSEGASASASATLVRVELDPCGGGEVVGVVPDADRAWFEFHGGRSPLPARLPAGRWCRLSVVLADVEIEVSRPAASLSLGDVTLVLDEGEFEVVESPLPWTLVLGSADWLEPVLTSADPSEPATLAEVEVRLGTGSSLYDAGGSRQISGPGWVPLPPPECDTSAPADLSPVIRDCDRQGGYEVDTRLDAESCETGLYVGAIYETHERRGEATVRFDVPGTHVLALSAYEATTWTIELGPRSALERVLIAGYERQEVRGVDVPVVNVPGPACGYSWPYNGGGCDTADLLQALEAAAGLPLTRFDGCYDAQTFVWELP